MEQVLKPVNLAGALLIVQVCLLIIMFLGVIIDSHNKMYKTMGNLILLMLLAIVSIVLVAFSYDFYGVWSPILGDVSLPTLARKSSFTVVFAFDLIVVAFLIRNSGGSNVSPFTSILFLIPSLAIFLRQTPFTFFTYAFMAYLIYYVTFQNYITTIGYSSYEERGSSNTSHKIVNCLCLALGVIIGYITRPITV